MIKIQHLNNCISKSQRIQVLDLFQGIWICVFGWIMVHKVTKPCEATQSNHTHWNIYLMDILWTESIYLHKEFEGLGFACYITKHTCLGPLLTKLSREKGLGRLPPWSRILEPNSQLHIMVYGDLPWMCAPPPQSPTHMGSQYQYHDTIKIVQVLRNP